MKNIKITFEYDGTNFFGYQRQIGLKTIQGEIESALSLFLNEKIEIVSAGRTDRGVHAKKQVCNFKTNSIIPPAAIKKVMRGKLAPEINIFSIEEADMEFSSRFSAKSRTYLYIMKENKNYSVFQRNYVTFIDFPIDCGKFMELMKYFIGKHDFDSFRKSDCNSAVSIREIEDIWIEEENEEYRLFVRGTGFLKSMIRIMVGSALAEYSGKKAGGYIVEKLKNPDKNGAKIVAPPQGLYLYDVLY